MSLRRLRALILIDALLLGIGLTAPFIVIVPSFGEFDPIVGAINPGLLNAQSYSILTTVQHLLAESGAVLGIVVFAFSVLFPVFKVSYLYVGTYTGHGQAETASTLSRRLEAVMKFSMLDVFLLALLVVAFKGLPGGSRVIPGVGCFLFAASILLSLVFPRLIAAVRRV